VSRRGIVARVLPLLILATMTRPVGAEPVTLRMAAIAPDGTAWARELKALARDVEQGSRGEVRIKWYLGGIAGDELAALDRVKRAQLDGEAGAIFCQRLAPTLRALRLVGVYQNRQEALYVIGRLQPTLDEEFKKAGFVNLGVGVVGNDVLFSNAPVRSMAELRNGRYWVWSLDPIWQATLPELGARMTATAVEDAAAAFGAHKVEGFFAVPSAALAFQWSTQAKYFADLGAAMLPGCLVVSNAAYDPLSTEQKQALTAAAGKFGHRFDGMSEDLEKQLKGGLFEKQGLIKVPVSPQFRAEFLAAAHAARKKLGETLVPAPLMAQIEQLLAEYRAHHVTTTPAREGR
jgi:TRAP-type C4-dicarboxylate transport system substrate-binding protein